MISKSAKFQWVEFCLAPLAWLATYDPLAPLCYVWCCIGNCHKLLMNFITDVICSSCHYQTSCRIPCKIYKWWFFPASLQWLIFLYEGKESELTSDCHNRWPFVSCDNNDHNCLSFVCIRWLQVVWLWLRVCGKK